MEFLSLQPRAHWIQICGQGLEIWILTQALWVVFMDQISEPLKADSSPQMCFVCWHYVGSHKFSILTSFLNCFLAECVHAKLFQSCPTLCNSMAHGLKIRTTWKQSMSILEANQSSSCEGVCLPCLVMSAIPLGGLPCLWPDLSFHFLVEWRWLGESQRGVGANEGMWPGCIM